MENTANSSTGYTMKNEHIQFILDLWFSSLGTLIITNFISIFQE